MDKKSIIDNLSFKIQSKLLFFLLALYSILLSVLSQHLLDTDKLIINSLAEQLSTDQIKIFRGQ